MYNKVNSSSNLKNQSERKVDSFADSKHVKMYELNPIESDSGTKTWWSRAQNFYMRYSEVSNEEIFERKNQVDEYVLILIDKESEAVVNWGGQEVNIKGFNMVIIPEGDSTVKINKGGRVVLLFSILNKDLSDLPINKDAYNMPDPNVPPFKPWPESPHGSKVRVYNLDIPQEEAGAGRIFRCSTFMIEFVYPFEKPRERLRPHVHNDYEQCSLVLEGEFIHHLRWPWVPDKAQWRPDEHESFRSPSVSIIPAQVIHTSEPVGSNSNLLFDIFSPPQVEDFVALNNNDYPLK